MKYFQQTMFSCWFIYSSFEELLGLIVSVGITLLLINKIAVCGIEILESMKYNYWIDYYKWWLSASQNTYVGLLFNTIT